MKASPTIGLLGLGPIGTALNVSSVVAGAGEAVGLLAVGTASKTGCNCVVTQMGGAGVGSRASGRACRSAVLKVSTECVRSGGARSLVPVLLDLGLELRVAGAADVDRVATVRAPGRVGRNIVIDAALPIQTGCEQRDIAGAVLYDQACWSWPGMFAHLANDGRYDRRVDCCNTQLQARGHLCTIQAIPALDLSNPNWGVSEHLWDYTDKYWARSQLAQKQRACGTKTRVSQPGHVWMKLFDDDNHE